MIYRGGYKATSRPAFFAAAFFDVAMNQCCGSHYKWPRIDRLEPNVTELRLERIVRLRSTPLPCLQITAHHLADLIYSEFLIGASYDLSLMIPTGRYRHQMMSQVAQQKVKSSMIFRSVSTSVPHDIQSSHHCSRACQMNCIIILFLRAY